MEITEKTIGTFFLKLPDVFIMVFPGAVVLGLVFNFCINSLENIYSFILFVFLDIIISQPFKFFLPPEALKYHEILLKLVAKCENIKIEERDLSSSRNDQKIMNIKYDMLFDHIAIKTLIFALGFHLMQFYSVININTFLGINIVYIRAIISFLICNVIGYYSSRIYHNVRVWSLKRMLCKKYNLKKADLEI